MALHWHQHSYEGHPPSSAAPPPSPYPHPNPYPQEMESRRAEAAEKSGSSAPAGPGASRQMGGALPSHSLPPPSQDRSPHPPPQQHMYRSSPVQRHHYHHAPPPPGPPPPPRYSHGDSVSYYRPAHHNYHDAPHPPPPPPPPHVQAARPPQHYGPPSTAAAPTPAAVSGTATPQPSPPTHLLRPQHITYRSYSNSSLAADPGRSQQPHPLEVLPSPSDTLRASGCTCKKSRCLKLYCQCFASSTTCGPTCKCQVCHNTTLHGEAIELARRTILERNPSAFDDKFRGNIHHATLTSTAKSPHAPLLAAHSVGPHALTRASSVSSATRGLPPQSHGPWSSASTPQPPPHVSHPHPPPVQHVYTTPTPPPPGHHPTSQLHHPHHQVQQQQQQPPYHQYHHWSSSYNKVLSPPPSIGPSPTPPPTNTSNESASPPRIHKLGCKCRRSFCLKKYCDCYQNSVHCGLNCRCINCKNLPLVGEESTNKSVKAPSSPSPSTPIDTGIKGSDSHMEQHQEQKAETPRETVVNSTESEVDAPMMRRRVSFDGSQECDKEPSSPSSLHTEKTGSKEDSLSPSSLHTEKSGSIVSNTSYNKSDSSTPPSAKSSPGDSKSSSVTKETTDRMAIMAAVAMTQLLGGNGSDSGSVNNGSNKESENKEEDPAGSSSASESNIEVDDKDRKIVRSPSASEKKDDTVTSPRRISNQKDGLGLKRKVTDTTMTESSSRSEAEYSAKKQKSQMISESPSAVSPVTNGDDEVRAVVSTASSVEGNHATSPVSSIRLTYGNFPSRNYSTQDKTVQEPQRYRSAPPSLPPPPPPPPVHHPGPPPHPPSRYVYPGTPSGPHYPHHPPPHHPHHPHHAPHLHHPRHPVHHHPPPPPPPMHLRVSSVGHPNPHHANSATPTQPPPPPPVAGATCTPVSGGSAGATCTAAARASPSYEDVIRSSGLPKSLSFRKICSKCGKTRGEHGELGFGNKCVYQDCGKCGAGIQMHIRAGVPMGILCTLTVEEGATPGAAEAYERKIRELASRAELQKELQKRKQAAAERALAVGAP